MSKVWCYLVSRSALLSGTGVKGNDLDLAGLVCNKLGDDQCINPVRGQDGGDNWEKRMEDLERFGEEKQGRWWDK